MRVRVIDDLDDLPQVKEEVVVKAVRYFYARKAGRRHAESALREVVRQLVRRVPDYAELEKEV